MADWHLRLVIVSFCIQVSPVFAEPDGKFHPLVPGLIAEPLPVDLPNCNNVQYRHDGKLVALGYQGQLYLLSDSDGDGVEDQVDVFWDSEGREVGQIGMDLAPKGSPYGNAVFLCVKGKILMVADQYGDDKAEVVQTIAEGWPPARAGVDVTGLALHPHDGSVWFGLGVRLYNDAYEIEATGVAKNDLSGERGAIYRIAPDFKSREKICTGIRWPIVLRFNERGDLFCTDQEGATWLPNGNPFDELLVIQKGRHYGFPPRHPTHLPKVIDEPSVFDYGPQHQSTCGMNFNVGVNGGPAFGPKRWYGLLELSFAGAAEHPVARGFTSLGLHDESYWDLEGDPASLDVIALAPEKGEPRPLFWTRELQNPDKKHHGRVFVSIPGHYSRSFDDPLFRVLLLRGIAWSASEPVDRFNNLIGAGVSLGE